MISEYHKKAYAVAGPMVLKPDGVTNSRANPFQKGEIGLGYILFKYILTIIKYLASFPDWDVKVSGLERRFERKLRKMIKFNNGHRINAELSRTENCTLHGCCLILSPQYVERFDGLNPKTFLFLEEQILYVQVRANFMTTAFLQNLSIIHVGNVATDMVVHSKVERRRFKYRHLLKSYLILIHELVKNGRNLRKAFRKADAAGLN
jgi:hypothetical protein